MIKYNIKTPPIPFERTTGDKAIPPFPGHPILKNGGDTRDAGDSYIEIPTIPIIRPSFKSDTPTCVKADGRCRLRTDPNSHFECAEAPVLCSWREGN